MTSLNINSYTDLELALMVMLNYFGVGKERKDALGSRYSAVQKLVNNLSHGIIPDGSSANSTEIAIKKALEELKPTNGDYDDFINQVILEVRKNEIK